MPKIVDFATGTDDEIAAMLDAHYRGIINIGDYWYLGDTRIIHLSTMTKSDGGEDHAEQDMTMVIVAINHDDLKEKIGTRTKAAITLQCREVLGNEGTVELGQHYGGTSQWSANRRRTWLNSIFIGALPSTIQPLVKTVVKKNLANHTNNTAGNDTEDMAFFLSYSEMFGDKSYSRYAGNTLLEGQQYEYYNSDTKRQKYVNENGKKSSKTNAYWLRSPANYHSNYIVIKIDGSANDIEPSSTRGIAPAFCL